MTTTTDGEWSQKLTLSFQLRWAKNSFVEDNIMNISWKFELHPPYDFWGEDLWIFAQILCLGCNGKNSKFEIWTKFMCNVRDYSRNIAVNFCQNISNEKNGYFHFTHYEPMET